MKKFSLYFVLATIACLVLFVNSVLAGVTEDYKEGLKLVKRMKCEEAIVMLDSVIANPDATPNLVADASWLKGCSEALGYWKIKQYDNLISQAKDLLANVPASFTDYDVQMYLQL